MEGKSGESGLLGGLVDISKPRFDQSTYWGRLKHFLNVTNPLNLLVSPKRLEHSKEVVLKYLENPESKEFVNMTLDELWTAKNLFDSAYHPETHEKQIFFGRMSAQVPGNLMITAAMLTFYHTKTAVVFWQWINQSFNAVVNYTNRSGGSQLTQKDILTAYSAATTGAVSTALILQMLAKKLPPIYSKLVPFVAVAAANCINIPLMRQYEIKDGIPLFDEKDKYLAKSSVAAKWAIGLVVFSRILMATPGMVLVPVAINKLIKLYPTSFSKPSMVNLVQTVLLGICLTFATPMCCALFPQKSNIQISDLEENITKELLSKGYKNYHKLFFNKGL